MISWWPGDGYAFDIQGVNNGTLQGGATFTAGKVRQAFNFDGVNGEVVSRQSERIYAERALHFINDVIASCKGLGFLVHALLSGFSL